MLRRSLPLALLASIVLAAGCDGCQEPLTEVPGSELPVGDQHQGRVLTYVGEEPLTLFHGDNTTLRFTRKNADGTPVKNDDITIEVHGSAVSVPGDTFVTDSGGGVDVPAAAGQVDGQATVVARATDLDGSIDEAVVHINVVPNPAATLVVTVDSDTRILVENAAARVIVGAQPPSCADLLAGAPEPSPQVTSTFTYFPSTQSFADMPTGARAVVVVDGLNAAGAVIARGCGETDALPGGGEADVNILLSQGNTTLAGDYDVLMHMALGDALPHPYDDDIEFVTALLADPGGFALYMALREIDRQTGFTTFVTHNGVEATYRQVEQATLIDPSSYPTWSFAREQLDQLLVNTLGQTYVDVTNVGAGIRDVVTDFEVGARFGVTDNDDGTLGVNEQWKDIVLYWPLPCAAGDLACARRPLTLDDLNLAPVTTSYGAGYDYAPDADVAERYAVTTDPHGLNVRYGALLVAILEQVVFPSLPGGSPGDNFGDFLDNLVGCSNIAASLTSDPTASQFISGVCSTAMQVAGTEIETRLEDLQLDASDPSVQGLQSSGTFALLDKDQDLTTELVADYDYQVGWFDPNNPGTFDDISTPITGDGVRVRPACDNDGDCVDGLVCTPRPSYLKIAHADLGCSAAKGVVPGGQACSGDAECATGLCAPVGAGGALQCYAACNAMADCSVGDICSDTGAVMDFDHVLNGLGDVPVQGCAAP